MGGRHDPRGAIQRCTEIIAVPNFSYAGMQTHAYLDRARRSSLARLRRRTPGVRVRHLQGALCGQARCERIRSVAEDRDYAIASGLDDAPFG